MSGVEPNPDVEHDSSTDAALSDDERARWANVLMSAVLIPGPVHAPKGGGVVLTFDEAFAAVDRMVEHLAARAAQPVPGADAETAPERCSSCGHRRHRGRCSKSPSCGCGRF